MGAEVTTWREIICISVQSISVHLHQAVAEEYFRDEDKDHLGWPGLDSAWLAKIYGQRKGDLFERLTLATAYAGQRVSMAHKMQENRNRARPVLRQGLRRQDRERDRLARSDLAHLHYR
ncbi:hypothetical protein ACFSQQ_40785 [Mesorhizobium kowhaii]|uniref:hypothetical protein n=1 Tax=Mesorhizobium kowhaii TaxID=1300272 RepID=UPI0035E48C8E